MELAHINTAHPDFIGVRKAMTLQNPHRNAASASNKAPPVGNNNDPSNVLNSSVSMNNNASTGTADNNSDVSNAAVSTGSKQQFQVIILRLIEKSSCCLYLIIECYNSTWFFDWDSSSSQFF